MAGADSPYVSQKLVRKDDVRLRQALCSARDGEGGINALVKLGDENMRGSGKITHHRVEGCYLSGVVEARYIQRVIYSLREADVVKG